MADQSHEHGSMDITDQEKTFEGFIGFTVKTVIAIAIFLILLYAING